MKVILLNPPYHRSFIRSARCTLFPISGSNWYPIFLAYATGWLEKHNHEVKLIDALIANIQINELQKVVKDFEPKLLVVYVSDKSLGGDISIAKKLKRVTGAYLVLVGPRCASEPEKILKEYNGVDAVVRREFDDVLLDLANGKERKKINGLIWRDRKMIISNPERPFLTPKQLNEFPFVAKIYKEHLPLKKYYQASLLHPFVDLFTARGCAWNKCTFCLWPNTIHKDAGYRARSIENVIGELKFIKKELPEIKEVFFQDDMLPAGRAGQLAQAIIETKLKMNWSCYTKADIDLQTLKLMKKSGCRFLHVGYESADPTVLKNICKGTDPQTAKRFTENALKAGLRIHGDFIFGLPGETESTIKKTIAWAKNLGIEGFQFFIPEPEKETPLYDWLKKHPDYSHLTNSQLSYWRFRAMKEIYLDAGYLLRTIRNIKSTGDFSRLVRTAYFVIPKMLLPSKD